MHPAPDGTASPARLAIRRQFEFGGEAAPARLDRLEDLLHDIDSDGTYPIDWLVYRVTGVKVEGGPGDPEVVRGDLLGRDLVSLIEELDRRIGPMPFDPERHLDGEEAARRLGVSRRTLQRWRQLGLVSRRLRHADGTVRTGVRIVSIGRFAQRHASRIDRARGRQPIDSDERERIEEAFTRCRPECRSRSEAISRVARQSGRSVSAIRRIVGGEERREESVEAGVEDLSHLIRRARDRAIPIVEIARRVGRSEDTVRRHALEARWTALGGRPRLEVEVPNRDSQDAVEVFTVAGSIDDLPRELEVATPDLWLERIRELPDRESDEVVRGRIAAMHFALDRAHRAIEEIDIGRAVAAGRFPGERLLDPIETDLRWWGLLLERNVVSGLPAGLQRLEQSLGRRLERIPAARLEPALALLRSATRDVVIEFDPTRRAAGHDLARAVGLAVSRRIAASDVGGPIVGAGARGIRRPSMPVETLRSVPRSVRRLLGVERWWRRVLARGTSVELREHAGFAAMQARHALAGAGRPLDLRATGRVVGRPSSRFATELEACIGVLRATALDRS